MVSSACGIDMCAPLDFKRREGWPVVGVRFMLMLCCGILLLLIHLSPHLKSTVVTNQDCEDQFQKIVKNVSRRCISYIEIVPFYRRTHADTNYTMAPSGNRQPRLMLRISQSHAAAIRGASRR